MKFLIEYAPDVSVFNVVMALLGVICCFFDFALMREAYRMNCMGKTLGIRTVLAIASGGVGVLLCRAAYSNTRETHLLRVGPTRYTEATITRSFFSRSGRKFVFRYRVGAYQGQGQGECGERCPAVGTRRYLRFAVDAPDVYELTPYYLDDSVRTVPSLGWERLPE